MNARVFVDTNVWIYAHLEKPGDSRNEQALRIISNPDSLVVSIQVLNEYYSVMKKNGAADDLIQANVLTILDNYETCWFTPELLRRSFSLRNRYQFSCWDSLILAAALESDCTVIYTEDLHHGQMVETVKIVNPFGPSLFQVGSPKSSLPAMR
jgi:predicted nucleic acid-binding protein